MWLWITFGWCAAGLAAAAIHHRLRRSTDRYPSEVASFLVQFETELAMSHPQVGFLGMLPDRFACLLRVDGQETVVGLHDAYRHVEAFPEALGTTVARLLTDVRDVGLDQVHGLDFATAAVHLLPQVRSRHWLAENGCFGDSGLVHQVLNADLVVVYVIDAPASMVFVCREHLRRWRKSVAELHQLAVTNLARRGLPPLPGDTPLVVQTGDGFDAARVLLLEPAEGLLVAIPDRDTLWVGRQGGQDLARLMATTEAIADQAPHPVSPQLFRVTDGQLVPVPAPR
jgi:hypothetical protein